jgi:hypothetical protein
LGPSVERLIEKPLTPADCRGSHRELAAHTALELADARRQPPP